MKVHFSSNSNEWATPSEFFEALNNKYNFTLDPCSTKENAKCQKFYTKEDDGLSKDWVGEKVFMNPPYSRELPKWIKKAYTTIESARERVCETVIVCLIPARTDTRYWHEYIFGKAKEINFIKGRLKFDGGEKGNGSAPFPSAVVIYDSKYSGETLYKTLNRNGETINE